MIKINKEFVEDFELWEVDLRMDGELDSGVNEIKQAIRDDWKDPELRKLWTDFVHERAEFRKELIRMSVGINERIRNAKMEA